MREYGVSKKIATCNEPWRDTPVEEVFGIARRLGFDGVEIAPFTIADDVRDVSAERRREIARAAQDAGVAIVGLHWLFISPKGLHLTTPDDAVRARSTEYLKALVEFCGDLGGTVMIFGSPKQRDIEPPNTVEEGWKRARDVFAAVGPLCAQRGVTIGIEALAPQETNFIQTAAEAARLADEVGHPNIGIMLDVKAMSSMPEGVIGTIRDFGRRAVHFHANEPDGKGAGMGGERGAVDWPATLTALQESGFDGWISLEPFDYDPDPTEVARTGIRMVQESLGR